VTNTNDSGAGSLRQAVNCAENGDTITFAPIVVGQTIVLTSGPIRFTKNINILQQSGTVVYISSFSKTLEVLSGVLLLQYIAIIAGCNNGYFGTAIRNYSDLILRDVTIIEDLDPSCGEASIFNLGNITIQGFTQIIK